MWFGLAVLIVAALVWGATAEAATRVGGPRVGPGEDSITGSGGDDRVHGGPGGDRIIELRFGHDWAWGDGGDDVIKGGRGSDRLWGGAGADRLDGGSGEDVLFGGTGDDLLTGGPGRDRLSAGPGDDTIHASGTPRDRVDCGPGRDTVHAPVGTPTRDCERVMTSEDGSPDKGSDGGRRQTQTCDDADPATTDYENPETGYCERWPYP